MLTLEEVKRRSADVLSDKGLNYVVAYGLELLIERCYKRGVNIRFTSGYRSLEWQQEIYNQGRTPESKAKGEKIVSNARPGHSMHNYGLAGDMVLIDSGYDMKADKDGDGIADWIEFVTQAKLCGFKWGGDWVTIKDNPHIEMSFGLTVKQLLAGQRPSTEAMSEAYNKMRNLKEEDDEMQISEELQIKINEMNNVINAYGSRIAELEKRVNISGNQEPPKWAIPAIEAAKNVNVIKSGSDKSQSDFVTIQTLYNLGLFDPEVIKHIKELRGL